MRRLHPSFSVKRDRRAPVFAFLYRVVLLLLLFIGSMAGAMAQTTSVVAYFPTYENFPNLISSIDLAKITHLNIAFANPNSSGAIVVDGASNSAVTTVVNAAHAKNVKVLLSIGGAGAPGSNYRNAFSNSTNMTNFVNNCVKYTTDYNLDGIDVDIEGDVLNGSQVTASQYQSFVTQLASALHAKNKIMTAALANWFGNYVTNTAAAQFDFINVMAYDAAIPDSGDQPGPHASYQFAVDTYNYWHNNKGVPGSKINIGVPFYGYGWGSYTGDPGGDSFASIVAKYPGAENYDQVGSGANAEYYNGIPTIKQKTAFAIQNGGGIMIWEISQDATGSKSLLSTIYQVIMANSNPVPDNLAKGKTVTVSSTESNTQISTTASNATDGSYTTRWSSLFADPQWLYVDLGGNYNVNRVKITWEAAYAKDYQIQISSNANDWSDLKAVTANTTLTNDVTGLSGTGRYVRILGTARATSYGYSIYELEVYGNAIESPYHGTAAAIPGTIQAEDYDFGGEGLAYHDADVANQGGAYRTDGVDIQATSDTGGGYNVGYITAGEWLKYMVNVTTAGTFDLSVRVAATGSTSTFHVEMDGNNISGTINVPNTGAWQTWQTVTIKNIALTAGQKTMRMVMDGGSFNLNYVSFQSSVPNQAPVVSLTAPSNNASFVAPASITINADASDADGTVSKVEFYNGNTLIGSDATAPYTFDWINVAAGTYTLSAKATDNSGAVTSSSSVTVVVASACLPVSASADDGNVPANVLDNDLNTRWSASGDGQWIQFCFGTIQDVSGVQIAFYNGDTRQSTFDIQVSSNGADWTNVLTGVHSSGTSLNFETFAFGTAQSAKYIRIVGHGNSVNTWNSFTEVKILTGTLLNQSPTVNLTAPLNNSIYTSPATLTLTANAADSDGSVTKVDFYNGTVLLGSDATAPYSFAWNNVVAGSYALTAKATDNAGAVTTSSVVSVVVNNPVSDCPKLTWSDDFNGTSLDQSKWNYQTGDGCPGNCGWGNNELEYYTSSTNNVSVSGGNLVLTAHYQPNYNGTDKNYTSGKLVTAGKFSQKYGRYEARIKVPSAAAIWPAFWMLADNTSWPATGEIDILETVNTPNTWYGTLHYASTSGAHQSKGATWNPGTPLSNDFHVYAVEWNTTQISWFIDGVLRGTATKAAVQSGGGVWPFDDQKFFIILNLAVGGNFPGQSPNSSQYPVSMLVDYVKVYSGDPCTVTQSPYGGTPATIPGIVQAENYDLGGEGVSYHDITTTNDGGAYRNDAVDLEACTDAGGGYDLGWTAAGEWTEYTVNVSSAGNYDLSARLASTATGKSFHVEMDGVNISGSIAVPNTGDWQVWQTVTIKNIPLTAGQKIMRIVMDTDGFNLNYIGFATSSGTSVNQAPIVSLTAPANNASYNAPASITMTANASDADGSVSKVEFYNGTTLLGMDNSAPYSYTWTNVAAGTYSVTAKATDNAGSTATTSAVTVKVNAVTANACNGIAQYAENNGYVAGSKVQNGGRLYECKPYPYSGWCNGAAWAYAPGTGSYWADAWTDKGSCSASARAEDNASTEWNVYPNPTAGQINLTAPAISETVNLSFIDVLGAEVMNVSDWQGESIDVSSLRGGVYTIIIQTSGNRLSKTFVKH